MEKGMQPKPAAPAELFDLMRRYNQLGRLLPREHDLEDVGRVAEARLILREMAEVQAGIDALLKRKN
jgi:hypothetical protein